LIWSRLGFSVAVYGRLVSRLSSTVAGCLEGRFTQRANLPVPRSEDVRGARERPLMTTVCRPFWHGHGTAVAIHAWRVSSGWNKAGHPLPCGRSSATLSELRFLISALLIVSGVFPQPCALIVPPPAPSLHHHDDLPSPRQAPG